MLSFATGWIIRGALVAKPEVRSCACHCVCYHPPEASSTGLWGLHSVLGLIVTVGAVLATNAVLALKVTVKSPQGEQEVAVHFKEISKGLRRC